MFQPNIKFSIIVAVCDNLGIGFENKMPWHVSEDLKRFKRLTTGNCVILGRKTFESIGNKPLNNRLHFVISRNAKRLQSQFQYENVVWCESVPEALEQANLNAVRKNCEVFVMGGAEVYSQTIKYCHKIELTKIHLKANCDAWFPSFEKDFLLEKNERILAASGAEVEFQTWARKL